MQQYAFESKNNGTYGRTKQIMTILKNRYRTTNTRWIAHHFTC